MANPDPWVENVQRWLNATYTGVPGWNPVTVDGRTGWATMRALTRALQHELGITALSDTFGAGTMSALTSFGAIAPTNYTPNIVNILIGGLYCKGYNAGNGQLPGQWLPLTTTAVQAIQHDIGIPQTGTVAPTLFRAILNMDAYVVVGSGRQSIREVQQWMNATYMNRSWFSLIPADGSYSRSVQVALVYAIQETLNVAGANGNYGPGTRTAVRSQSSISVGSQDSPNRYWVRLFQAALRFNQYEADFNGVFSARDAAETRAFQSFAALPVTGQGDYQTWSSLLVSNGDPDRVGIAADTATPVTSPLAGLLFATGKQVIGRYLTNATSPTALNKKLQPGEIETIFNAGLRIFPIFQTSGLTASYFSSDRGRRDALEAIAAASNYGFHAGTVIYFAVDFDATDVEISNNIIPHFRAVREAALASGGRYRVGVYGTRNVCKQVSDLGYADLSFVAGMSTGYSGNLGFRLPSNWAFDQISSARIGVPPMSIEIDNNISSGRDYGQATVANVPSDGHLDAAFNPGLAPALVEEIKEYCLSVDHNSWLLIHGTATQSITFAVTTILAYDNVITATAQAWGIRKAFIQAVATWEIFQLFIQDLATDEAVRLTYFWLTAQDLWEQNPIGSAPLPPVTPLLFDSSTGFGQIYAKVAITAHNWAIQNGFASPPSLDSADWRTMWQVWQKLNEDNAYNLSMAAAVLMAGAAGALEPGDEVIATGPPRLTYTDEQITKILSRYNGHGNDAELWGEKVRGVYNIYERYNAALRG